MRYRNYNVYYKAKGEKGAITIRACCKGEAEAIFYDEYALEHDLEEPEILQVTGSVRSRDDDDD